MLKHYPAKTDAETYAAMMALRTDQRMTLPLRTQLRWLSDAGIPAWCYFLTRVPPWQARETMGAHHGAEITYIFGGGVKCGQFNANAVLSDADRRLSETLMAYWTNFAARGDPERNGFNGMASLRQEVGTPYGTRRQCSSG